MSEFYGVIHGSAKKSVSRCGSRKSGLVAKLLSHHGEVVVQLHSQEGRERFLITVKREGASPHQVEGFLDDPQVR